jgi:hypothetical protein
MRKIHHTGHDNGRCIQREQVPDSERARVCCGTRDFGRAFGTGDSRTAICAGNEAVIAGDASGESNFPIEKEYKSAGERETAEWPSVPEKYLCENEAMIVADASEERKSPNQKECESVRERETAE